MARLTTADEIKDNLRQCCEPQLNKRLFDVKGVATLNQASEDNLLGWIKEIAVKGVHKEVHRTQIVNLKQKQGETISSFYGRLKSEAALCDFVQCAPTTCADGNACNCKNHGVRVSYNDDMVATQLVAGLYNTDFQAKILAESTSLTTLDQKLNRLLTLEKSETSLSSLSGNDAMTNYTGGVKGDRSRGPKKQDKRRSGGGRGSGGGGSGAGGTETCSECNSKHPQCPKCNGHHKCTTQCNSCQAMGHIKNCCPNNEATNASLQVTEEDDVVFQFHVTSEIQLAMPLKDSTPTSKAEPLVSSASLSISAELLSHMECINERFQKMRPQNAPYLQVKCRLLVDVHASYGKNVPHLEKYEKLREVSGLADTGAQVCTAGSDLLTLLGITEEHLVRTVMGVKGVTQSPVTVLGALFLEVSASGMCTKQIVYIARGARSLILSEKALKDLGVLPDSFPSAGMFTQRLQEVNAEVGTVTLNDCGCPLRAEVPPIPKVVPIEKPEQNRALLQK